MRHNKRPIPRRLVNGLGHLSPAAGDLAQLVPERGEYVGAPAGRAEHHLPPASSGDDERARLVVEREAVRVRAHGLGHLAVQARLADFRVVELARAADGRLVGGRARRQARVEDGPLDAVVRVRVDAVAGFDGRVHLQVPGAPLREVAVGEARLPRRRVRGVAVRLARPSGRPQEAGRADAGGVGKVRRDVGGVGGGDVDDGQRQVVAVYEADVVEGLAVAVAAAEVELGKGCRGCTLVVSLGWDKMVDRKGRGGGTGPYRELAVENTETVSRQTSLSIAVPAVEVGGSRSVLVEGAVRTAPYAALPCRTNEEGHGLTRDELEAAETRTETVLCANARPDGLRAVVGHAQGHIRLVRSGYARVLGVGAVHHGRGEHGRQTAAEEAMSMA